MLNFVVTLSTLLSALSAHAEASRRPMIEVMPLQAAGSASTSIGYCPCYRWTVHLRAAGGQIEWQDFLVSSQAMIEWTQSRNPYFRRIMSQLVKVGAIEALWKSGHIGIGFDGGILGDSKDQKYNDFFRTGFHVLVNVVRTDHLRVDVRSGYAYETVHMMFGPKTRNDDLPQSVALEWSVGPWAGHVTAGIDLTPADPLDFDGVSMAVSAGGHFEMFRLSELVTGLGIEASVSNDPFRETYGLEPLGASLELYLDLSWISSIGGSP